MVLIVGQTPPPYGGQAIMIKYMLDNFQSPNSIKHVRMCFSKEFNDRGKLSLYKIVHPLQVIVKIKNDQICKCLILSASRRLHIEKFKSKTNE